MSNAMIQQFESDIKRHNKVITNAEGKLVTAGREGRVALAEVIRQKREVIEGLERKIRELSNASRASPNVPQQQQRTPAIVAPAAAAAAAASRPTPAPVASRPVAVRMPLTIIGPPVLVNDKQRMAKQQRAFAQLASKRAMQQQQQQQPASLSLDASVDDAGDSMMGVQLASRAVTYAWTTSNFVTIDDDDDDDDDAGLGANSKAVAMKAYELSSNDANRLFTATDMLARLNIDDENEWPTPVVHAKRLAQVRAFSADVLADLPQQLQPVLSRATSDQLGECDAIVVLLVNELDKIRRAACGASASATEIGLLDGIVDLSRLVVAKWHSLHRRLVALTRSSDSDDAPPADLDLQVVDRAAQFVASLLMLVREVHAVGGAAIGDTPDLPRVSLITGSLLCAAVAGDAYLPKSGLLMVQDLLRAGRLWSHRLRITAHASDAVDQHRTCSDVLIAFVRDVVRDVRLHASKKKGRRRA